MIAHRFIFTFLRVFPLNSRGSIDKVVEMLVCGWELGNCPWSWKPPQPSLLQDCDLLASGLAFISPNSDSFCFISPFTLVWIFLFTPIYVTLIDASQVFT